MYPAKEREKACPPITTFHLIMKTPKRTSITPKTVLLIVSPGIRKRINGKRFPNPYWRIKISVKSLP